MLRNSTSLAAMLVAALLISACVPTTGGGVDADGNALPVIEVPRSVDQSTAYLATADNGFTVPAVPVEQVPAPYRRQVVAYETEQAPGTIIINPAQRVLYFVTGPNKAIRYGIAVGRDGFDWSGEARITDRKPWPTWTPPPEMIERKPELIEFKDGQPGGPTNPLGARALYLTTNGVDYGYRIHGTPEWQSIGSNASSGCIRMINQDVIDLYGRVPNGAKVIVMTRSGDMPTGLTLPPPQPRRAKPTPAPVAAAEPVLPDLPPPPPLDPELIAAPAVVLPVTVAPATAVVPVAPAPAAPAPAAAAPACVPTAAKPCPAPVD